MSLQVFTEPRTVRATHCDRQPSTVKILDYQIPLPAADRDHTSGCETLRCAASPTYVPIRGLSHGVTPSDRHDPALSPVE